MEEMLKLTLTLFGEGGGEGGAGDGAGAGPAEAGPEDLGSVIYGKQGDGLPDLTTGSGKADADAEVAEFDAFIREHKAEYDKRMQSAIKSRLKNAGKADAALKEHAPIMELLAQRYGVDAADAKALLAALEDDDQYLEDQAMSNGLSIDQQREFNRMTRENERFRAEEAERQRQAQVDQIYSTWSQDAENLKAVYPGFDLNNEISNPETGARYSDLLKAGIDVKTAYEVVHKDELMGGAIQYTAQRVQEKTLNDIRARGMRPSENGAAGKGASRIVKSDPSKFTKADRDEIARRVMRGERVEL